MIPDIQDALQIAVSSRKSVYPNHVNRISELDHDCKRYLYYSRTAWDKSAPPSDYLQGVFETGKVLETVIVSNYNTEIGPKTIPPTRIVGTQTTTHRDKLLEDYKISGTIDGFLQSCEHDVWKTIAVIDIKTCSPNTYRTLNVLADLTRYPWTKKYCGQVTLYALGTDIPHCAILLVNKANIWDMHTIDWPLDLGFAEELLQKAKVINEAVEAQKPPEKINRPDLCEGCRFEAHCMPELTIGKDVRHVEDPTLIGMIDRMLELKEFKSEHDRLNKQINSMLIQGQDIFAGKYLIKWSQDKNGRWSKKIQE